jgi:DNA-binding transcriptional MerR regulator
VNRAAPPLPEPVFTVGGAARRLGIPVGTLRTWERRHGIGPSGRSPGGHRRYTAGDLSRLRAMRTMVDSGIPPAQAAALATLAAPGDPAATLAARVQAALEPPGPAAGLVGPPSGPVGPPSGAVGPAAALAGPEAGPVAPPLPPDAVIQAANRLDAPLLLAVFRDTFARQGVTVGWQQLAVPALREVGGLAPQAAGHGAAEHVLSGCLLAALLEMIAQAPAVRALRPVVLGCAAEEQHVLPVYALHAELAGRGVDVRQLGSRVPQPALAHAITAVQPAAVFLWSQLAATANPGLLDGLPAGVRPVVGGPGWQRAALPAGVHLVGTLEHAADLLTQSAFSAG